MLLRKVAALLASACTITGAVTAPQTTLAQKGKKAAKAGKTAKAGNASAQVRAVVNAFENAYRRQDSKTMLMALMVPTGDKVKIQQRYEWLRGNGPGDAPNTAPPLFKSARGSFVPTKYSIVSATPAEAGKWTVVVREEGTSRDEDGRYKVARVRHFDVVQAKGKWYVGDYYLKTNRENYGFPVDDISDKMTKMQ